ncbi:hypothetical protein ASE00_17585 [Sphingomonas sp. Root710]|uniref:hypothetical protein n=1 Tax=Sphingomonas sp. Root710 TaxID=1736594 RepID=UPI0006FECD37|nr:hypothetical protein [Sphingomonas sp. Root710]KRB80828.1 hypothetical protein ASE00_17585 [Sphingomonas sp. Root710]
MRRALHLLILAAVLCCGLHLGNEAQAREHVAQHLLETGNHDDAGDDGASDAAADLADGGHHHCPASPAPRLAAICGPSAPKALLTAMPVAVLHSRSSRPPVEPPLA